MRLSAQMVATCATDLQSASTPLPPAPCPSVHGWEWQAAALFAVHAVCLSVCPGSHTLAAKPLGAAHRRSRARVAEPSSCIWASSVSPTASEREGCPSASSDSPTGGEAEPQAGRVGEALSDPPAEHFRVPKCPMQSMSFVCLWAELGLSMGCHPSG